MLIQIQLNLGKILKKIQFDFIYKKSQKRIGYFLENLRKLQKFRED